MAKDSILKKNKMDIAVVLVVAIISGLIFYYPNHSIKRSISNDRLLSEHFVYSPLVSTRIAPVQDELKYAAYTRKAMDGDICIGDPDIYERRNDVSPVNKLPYIIAGVLSRLLGSVNSFFMLSDFLFPFLSILIGYFFLRLFLKNKLVALWGIIILLSMYSFWQLFNVLLFDFDSAFQHTNNFRIAFNVFALKYPSYQIIFPFTFLFYLCCYQLLTKNSSMYCVFTGLLLGLSSYMYLYSFITLALQVVLLTAWTFSRGKKDLALKFFLSGMMALLISIFYIKNILIFSSGPDHIYKSMTAGLTKSVDYNIVKTLIKFLFCSALLLYIFRKMRSLSSNIVFILSIMIPAVVIMLLSMVIFFLPQTQHLNTFEARNVVVISLLLLVSILLKKDDIKTLFPQSVLSFFSKRRRLSSSMRICILAIIVLHSGQIAASELYYVHQKSTLYNQCYMIDKDVMAAYDWLDKYAPKNSVVLSLDEQQISMVPVFSGLYVYIPDMFLSMCTVEEVWDRIKQGFGVYGVDGNTLKDILSGYKSSYSEDKRDVKPVNEVEIKHREQVYLEFKKVWFPELVFHGQFLFDSKSLSFQHYSKYLTTDELKRIKDSEKGSRYFQGIFFVPSNVINEQLTDYKSEAGNINLLKHKADYVWFGPLEKNLSGIEHLESDKLKPVFQNQKVTIYKFSN